jgi:hypothetical protein
VPFQTILQNKREQTESATPNLAVTVTLHQRVEIAVAAAHVQNLIDHDRRRKDRAYVKHSVDANDHVIIKVGRECGFILRRGVRL